MADGGQAGLLDLEKELTCSASASKPNPFTCPSCRASVRETRPNATVTTLLDMYLQANPGRGRTQEEKDELKQKYRNGEQVLPKVQIQRNDPDDERMLAEIPTKSPQEEGDKPSKVPLKQRKSHAGHEANLGGDRKMLLILAIPTRVPLQSHLSLHVRLYQDLISSKHTQHLLATNVEHQANSEGRLLHRPVHPRDRYPLGTYIRLLARQLTYQRERQAQDLTPGPTNRSAKIEGPATQIVACAIGVVPETYNTIRTGTARDVTMGSTTSAYNAICLVGDVFTGMALGLSPSNHYVSLTLSTQCDICEKSIPPSTTRFHCPQCNEGDYNICTESYQNLISTNRISRDDGDKGWRRCPSGHRMIITAFEDSSAGQRRTIVKDRVGGYALREHTASGNDNAPQVTTHELSWRDGDGQQRVRTLVSKQPVPSSGEREGGTTENNTLQPHQLPSGGSGTRALALWVYWPEDPSPDDLSFPRGAEIVEVENVNGDWFVGWYAGRNGV
ncbi:MAG: hypothetical protein Q9203_004220, partial [Teloschistes exilis]